MKDAKKILIDLFDKILSTRITHDKYPSKEIYFAYMNFIWRLSDHWLFKSLYVKKVKIGNFNKIKRLIIKLYSANVDKTDLNQDSRKRFKQLYFQIWKIDYKEEYLDWLKYYKKRHFLT